MISRLERDSFVASQPLIPFCYFVSVFLFTMLFFHPAILVISLISSACYCVYLNGFSSLLRSLMLFFPFCLITIIFNPLFNHRGATPLFYLNSKPITLEAVYYGIALSVAFLSILLWFSCYNAVMTSDKLTTLFGGIMPTLSLLFCIIMRFVPHFKSRLQASVKAQKGIGNTQKGDKPMEKLRFYSSVFSGMATWALESSIETADSMKSRGYGLKGRTSYSPYRFTSRDGLTFFTLFSLLALLIFGGIKNGMAISYFNSFNAEASIYTCICGVSFAIFCLLPLILNCVEELKWLTLKSKI